MLELLWAILKSKSVKVGGSILGGSGLIVLITGLHSNVSGKIDAQKIELKADTREYVGLVLEPLKTEISNLKTEQTTANQMIKEIRDYLIQKPGGN